jgi:two-component system, cell cycle sensor histidine kinase and response regulator CckA
MKPRHSRYVRMGMIFVTSTGFLLLSVLLKNWTEHNIFPILFPAVALSSWLGGRLGGLIATIGLSLGTAYYHLPPAGLAVSDPADMIRLGTFTATGAFVAWMSGALKESQSLMMATLRSIGDAVIATDRRGNVRFLNPVAESLTGCSQKDAKRRPLAEVFRGFHSPTGEALQFPSPDVMQGVLEIEDGYLISRAGGEVPIDDSFAPVQMESGRVLGSILVFRDATKRKQSEAALLEAQRQRLQAQRLEMVGRFAGGVAHDFNNLLTIISGYAEVALKHIGSDSTARFGLEEIRSAGERAAGLTRQLLVFSRGKPAKLEAVDLNRIIANFETMLRRIIGEDIELVTGLSNEPLFIQADVGQIEQVIMNLAVNARDAMPQGGRLQLATSIRELVVDGASQEPDQRRRKYALLAVTDSGSGMDEQTLERLFEPFFSTKEVGKGTGLGLSVIYGIVKGHGGILQVDSHLGEGSTFEVYLPLRDAVPASSEADRGPQEVEQSAGMILLVEDNPEVQKLMLDMLTSLGYQVLVASDGEEALRVAREYPGVIHLLLTDIIMPALAGPELARRLARSEMKVLYVSGQVTQESAASVLRDDNAAFLQKPFTLAALASAVQTMVSRSKGSHGR